MPDQVVGYVCLVRLHHLERLLWEWKARRTTGTFPYNSYKTHKRELEYLGGRMAAKLAAAAWSAKHGSPGSLDWGSLLVRAGLDEQRICYQNGKYAASVGITHSGRWAAAIAMPALKVALDLEDAQRRKIAVEAFHRLELQNGDSAELLREYWTLKETVAKLLGVGILGFENEIFSYTHGRQRWIGVVSPRFFLGRALVACRTTPHFSMAIGFDSSGGMYGEGSEMHRPL
jgi:phosphopantetheinyl transferase (holo-ACP synthase)